MKPPITTPDLKAMRIMMIPLIVGWLACESRLPVHWQASLPDIADSAAALHGRKLIFG